MMTPTEILLAILAAQGLCFLGLAAWSFRQSLRRIEQRLPTDELLRALNQTSEQLGAAALHFPTRITDGVRAGLQDVAGALTTSSSRLDQAILSLGDDGRIPEWLASTREVIEPLRLTADSVNTNHAVLKALMETTHRVVKGWEEQSGRLEIELRRFSEELTRATVQANTHLRDIENRLHAQIEAVGKTNENVARALSELKTASIDAAYQQKQLARSVAGSVDSVRAVADSVRTVADHTEQTRQQLELALQEQNAQRRHLEAWQTTTNDGLKGFHDQLSRVPEQVGKDLQGQVQVVLASLDNANHALSDYHSKATRKLEEMVDHGSRATSTQLATAEKAQEAVRTLRASFANLPSRTVQLGILICLVLQSAVVLAVVLQKALVR